MTIQELEQRFMDHTPGLTGVRSHYAVLVPLVEWQGRTHVLFEVRADTLRSQPGEVCFPGGRMEPGESPTECAFRETWEELGIPASAIRPIARLDGVFLPSDGIMHPVLAQVDAGAVVHMTASAAEVKETFLVPADFFPQGYPWRTGTHQVPIWTYKGHVIWGLTARILLWNLGRQPEGGGS